MVRAGRTSTGRSAKLTKALDYALVRDLDELRESWTQLYRGVGTRAFYHRWEWHKAVHEYLLEGRLVYHCFYQDQKLVAVFPLFDQAKTRRRPSYQALEAPAHAEIFVADALVHDDHWTRTWVDALLEVSARVTPRPDVLVFDRVPERSCLSRALQGPESRIHRAVVGGSASCDCTTADSLSKLSKKHLKNVDRLLRRAERDVGKVEHIRFVGEDAQGQGLAHFVDIESAGWKGPEGEKTSLSCTPTQRSFYRALLSAFSATGDARVDVLSIGGSPAAAQIALRSEGTWNLLKIGFNETFAALGPGNILLKMFIEEMARTPDVTTVSLVTAPEWAARWHLDVENTYEIRLFGATHRARLLAFLLSARERLREARSRVTRSDWRQVG